MFEQAIFAYFHYLSLFGLAICLAFELSLYRPELTAPQARRLVLTDMTYGIFSLLVVGTGFARAFWFAKGWEFYSHNPIFWFKVGIVLVWAVLSLPPTFHFLSWRKDIAEKRAPEIDPVSYGRVRKCLVAQAGLIPVVPLLAVLMARGLGSN